MRRIVSLATRAMSAASWSAHCHRKRIALNQPAADPAKRPREEAVSAAAAIASATTVTPVTLAAPLGDVAAPTDLGAVKPPVSGVAALMCLAGRTLPAALVDLSLTWVTLEEATAMRALCRCAPEALDSMWSRCAEMPAFGGSSAAFPAFWAAVDRCNRLTRIRSSQMYRHIARFYALVDKHAASLLHLELVPTSDPELWTVFVEQTLPRLNALETLRLVGAVPLTHAALAGAPPTLCPALRELRWTNTYAECGADSLLSALHGRGVRLERLTLEATNYTPAAAGIAAHPLRELQLNVAVTRSGVFDAADARATMGTLRQALTSLRPTLTDLDLSLCYFGTQASDVHAVLAAEPPLPIGCALEALDVAGFPAPPFAIAAEPGTTPALRSLVMRGEDAHLPPLWDWRRLAADAPALRRLQLANPSACLARLGAPESTGPPHGPFWPELELLVCCDPKEADHALALWPRLKQLALWNNQRDLVHERHSGELAERQGSPRPGEPLRTHRALTALSLDEQAAFPRGWALPQLRELEVRTSHPECREGWTYHWPALHCYLARVAPALERLQLTGMGVDCPEPAAPATKADIECTESSRLLPALVHLTLGSFAALPPGVAALLRHAPALRSLALTSAAPQLLEQVCGAGARGALARLTTLQVSYDRYRSHGRAGHRFADRAHARAALLAVAPALRSCPQLERWAAASD